MADVAPGVPLNGTIEKAGSERLPLDEIVGRFLNANRDPRQAAADIHARCFGTELNDRSLVPGDNPRIGPTRFADWFNRAE